MADTFLALDGIFGESTDAVDGGKHTHQIEVVGWSWGMDNGAPLNLQTKEASAKPKPDDITITKGVDVGSTALMQACAQGDPISTATLTCRKNAGEHKLEYLIIDFQDAKVSSVKWDAGEDGHISETVVLTFAKFKTRYRAQDDATGDKKGSTEFGFHISRNFDF